MTEIIPAHLMIKRAVENGMSLRSVKRILGYKSETAGGTVLRRAAEAGRIIPPAGTWDHFRAYLAGIEIQAPEGIPFYQGKAPYVSDPSGHGFLGVVLHDKHSSLVQCHECGGWYRNAGIHAAHFHHLYARAYKIKHGLRIKSALCSEGTRELLIGANERRELAGPGIIQSGLQTYNKRHGKGVKRPRDKDAPTWSMQTRNERGLCPEQLLERIREVAKRTGRNAIAWKDLVASGIHWSTLISVFGSPERAMELAGVSTPRRRYYEPHVLLEMLIDFRRRNGRWPTKSDARRGLIPRPKTFRRYFGGIRKAKQIAEMMERTLETEETTASSH